MVDIRSGLSTLFLVGLCIGAGAFHLQAVSGGGTSARDLLIQDLLKDYHSSVEPSGVVDLRFGLALVCVRFEKAKAELTTTAWERYTWNDFRLSWDPKDFDGIKKLRVPPGLIWKPDIECINALDEGRSIENIVIDFDGTVMWVPRAHYKTLCTFGDEKPICELSFGSWTYDHWAMSLELDAQGIELGHYMNTTCPWLIENHTSSVKTTTYSCCPEAYTSIDISLNLKPLEPEAIAVVE